MADIVSVVKEYFPLHKEIPVDAIELKEEVRKLCEQNTCGNYNKNWTCPPAIGPIQDSIEKFKKYAKFIVVYEVYQLADSFDWRGMTAGGKDFRDRLLKMKHQMDEHEDFLVLGAGGCHLCEKCTYPEGKPCRNPEDAIISCEAYGMDVMSLMKKNDLKYNNGPNTMTLIAGVLYQRSNPQDLGD